MRQWLLVVALFPMLLVVPAYADHFEISLPESMNVNDEYLVHIRIPDTSSSVRTISLLANDTSVTIPPRITVAADSQAATFEIYPTSTGHFEITAVLDRVTHRATFSVYEKGTIDDTEEVAIHLWTPKHVVAGTQYSGYVLLDTYSPSNRIIQMAGDNVIIPDDITILGQSHSVLFQFTPLAKGDAFIVAATDGESSRAEMEVYEGDSISNTKTISLYSHESTMSGNLMVVASLENEDGVPLDIPEDTTVSLKATAGISVPASIVVPAGDSQVLIHAVLRDSGTISASSPDFDTGAIDVGVEEKELSIHIDAAPSPGLPGSVGYFFVWLEDKNGDLYRKSGVTEVFLTSTVREVASFEQGRYTSHGIITVPMVDGLYGGQLYMGREGSADITASTSGYGTDTVRVNVGAEVLDGECGVFVLENVVTSVTLELQDDTRTILQDELNSAKVALDSAGPGGMFSDIRDVRHELYRYDEESHDRLESAVLDLNDSLGGTSTIDAGSISLDADGLRDLYIDLARVSSDAISLDSHSIQSAVEDVRIAIVHFELDGDRNRLDGALESLRTVLTESGYGSLMGNIDAAAGRSSGTDFGDTPEEALQRAKDILNGIRTDESRALLDAILVYVGEKTIERVYVERSRAAIESLEDHVLSDSDTFDLPEEAAELYLNNDVADRPDRQDVLDLQSAIGVMQDATGALGDSFLDESLDGLSEELRAVLVLDAVNEIMESIQDLPLPPENEENARSIIEDTLETLRDSVDVDSRAAELITIMATEFGSTETFEDALSKLDAALILLQNDSSARIDILLDDVQARADSITFWDVAAAHPAPLDILNAGFIVPDEVITTLLAVDRIPGYSIVGINQNVFTYTHVESQSDASDLVDADLASLQEDYAAASEAVNMVRGQSIAGSGGAGNALRLALDNMAIGLASADRGAAYDAYESLKDTLGDYYRDAELEDQAMDDFYGFRYALEQADVDYDMTNLETAIEALYIEVADDPRDVQPIISNQITLDIIPDTTDSIAYGVVAQYVMRDTLDRDGAGRCLVEPDEIGPYSLASRNVLKYEGQLDGGTTDAIVVSSTGDVSHEPVLRPDEIQKDGRHRGAILFQLESGDVGEHTVTVSIDDHAIAGLPETINSVSYVRVSGSDGSASFTVQEKPTDEISFVGVPVPENGGIVGLAGVVRDGSVIWTNVETIGDITLKRMADQYVVYGNDTYSGTLTALDLRPIDISIDVSDLSSESSVELDVPAEVRVGEPFPYYFHVFDNGVPMQPNTGGRVSLPDIFLSFTGNELLVPLKGEDYKITVISEAGTATESVEAVSSPLEVSVGEPPSTVQVGEDFFIMLNSQIEDIVYKILTNIPTQHEDDRIRFSPNVEGNHTVSITGERPGYEPYVDEFSVNVENMLNVYVESAGADAVPFDMTLFQERTESTPFDFRTEPTSLSITFPLQHVDDTGGYKFERLTVGPTRDLATDLPDNTLETAVQTDLYVVAHYERDIRVTVLGAEGSGVYARGDTVTVRAYDEEIIPILLYERFDGWSGPVSLHGHADTFIAESDVVITASYYTDHSAWMFIVVVGVAIVAVTLTLKRSSKFAWMFSGLKK